MKSGKLGGYLRDLASGRSSGHGHEPLVGVHLPAVPCVPALERSVTKTEHAEARAAGRNLYVGFAQFLPELVLVVHGVAAIIDVDRRHVDRLAAHGDRVRSAKHKADTMPDASLHSVHCSVEIEPVLLILRVYSPPGRRIDRDFGELTHFIARTFPPGDPLLYPFEQIGDVLRLYASELLRRDRHYHPLASASHMPGV